MSFITVTKGGPTTDIPDGVYPVSLIDIKGPKTVTARRGVNAGKDIELLDWSFAVDGGPMNGYEIEVSSSMASGPRSKLYAFLTALFGGQAPAVGQGFDKEHLIGRQALATIAHDDGGWPIIANLGAMPTQMQQQAPQAFQQPVAVPQPPAVPTNTQAMVPQPLVAPPPPPPLPPAAQDDLPF